MESLRVVSRLLARVTVICFAHGLAKQQLGSPPPTKKNNNNNNNNMIGQGAFRLCSAFRCASIGYVGFRRFGPKTCLGFRNVYPKLKKLPS